MNSEPNDSVELVVTGPGRFGTALAYKTRARTTMGVLTQLLAEAEREVIISAPFLQEGHGLSAGPIGDALLAALNRGVHVDILTTGRALGSLDHHRLEQAAKGKLRLFRPVVNVEDEKRLGSHAKFWLADGIRAYVGSANLTRPGLTEHVELGLLVEGAAAKQIKVFWDCCVQIGLFQRVESPRD